MREFVEICQSGQLTEAQEMAVVLAKRASVYHSGSRPTMRKQDPQLMDQWISPCYAQEGNTQHVFHSSLHTGHNPTRGVMTSRLVVADPHAQQNYILFIR